MYRMMEDKIKAREKIEWVNYWIEEANEKSAKRILILGDSVARDYRKILNKKLQKENYVVDLLAMSFGILDELLLEEIKHFVNTIGEQYQYQCILFNLGAHHGYSSKCVDNEEIEKLYVQRLEKIFEVLNWLSNNIVTISGTPENIYDSEVNNDEIEKRNCILKDFSWRMGYTYIDIYQNMFDMSSLLIDKFHYSESGYEYMSSIISEALGVKSDKVPSNKLDDLKGFLKALKGAEKIFIYGDGIKGKLLYKYVRFNGFEVERKFIVSEGFYRNKEENILLEEVIKDLSKKDIVLVTPESSTLWKELTELGVNYCTLSRKIYTWIAEYVNAYIENETI